MITNYKKHHRCIATFFLLIFFPTILPNNLFASTNGPKSPEAASFEPVDATDMVNLITGQYSYVLPLLNVPSPEGGYPLALSYHAGIALDQEASWTGLGWNVNPGAIDRSVNGYPDDYSGSHLNEYFYDQGATITSYSASLGFSSYSGLSVGVGFNWGSNQSLGGSVSIGYGPKVGESGAGFSVTAGRNGDMSIGVGVSTSSLSFGASINSNGNLGANLGFNSNGAGMSIGYNTNGSSSMGLNFVSGSGNLISVDFTLSSSGVGVSGGVTNRSGNKIDGGVGSGIFLGFNNTVAIGDYNTSTTGWMIPIFVPTQIGVFSATFGKQKFKYWMGKNVENYVTGPLYYHRGVVNPLKQVWVPDKMERNGSQHYSHICGDVFRFYECVQPGTHWAKRNGYWTTVEAGRSLMDINEIPIEGNQIGSKTDVSVNNMTFPGYDSYNVQAQGFSGSVKSILYDNGALFGLDSKENQDNYALKYSINGSSGVLPDFAKFDMAPNFVLSNEISSYLDVTPTTFNFNTNNSSILDYNGGGGVQPDSKPRRRTSTFIETYTNNEIVNNYAALKTLGYLQPNISGLNRVAMPKDGIGAFKVTTVDGKTYHYSLPVYNHEIITRTFGIIPESSQENQSYFEKRQLEPFATHWLLTAVTGSDFVDNGDGVAGDGDLGYWTSFEYGKWTDAFIWKAPFAKDHIIDETDPNIKTWVRGRKQLYYLDRIKTRTHTAVFIKSERQDSKSMVWSYKSVVHQNGLKQNSATYDNGLRFTVPEQPQLRLDKIVLIKNQDDVINKNSGATKLSTFVAYNNSDKEKEDAEYNCKNNIIDLGDNWAAILSKAVKVIDFNYDYSLVPGQNRLTLKNVDFKGKGGASVLPPYKFDYINDDRPFDIDNQNGWGYLTDKPEAFSLNKIETPEGGIIKVNYEKNNFRSVVPFELIYNTTNTKYKCSISETFNSNGAGITLINGTNDFSDLPIGKMVEVDLSLTRSRNRIDAYTKYYKGSGYISSANNGVYGITLSGPVIKRDLPSPTATYYFESCSVKIALDNNSTFKSGGIRVNSMVISDGINNHFTDYKYGQNEDGVGYVSYVPYSQYVTREVPYSAELPAPRVMYEYVTMSSYKQGAIPEGKIRYKFNVMKEKSIDKIKFGNFYEIIRTQNAPFVNSSKNKEVSVNSFTIKDNLASLGQLLEVVVLNSKGQLLNKIFSTFYNQDDIPNNMGVTQESYQSYKEVDYTDTAKQDKWIINSSTRIKYPSIIKSSTEQSNGYTYTTQFNDYDLISGVSKEQVYTSSNGQGFKTKIVPAYIKYPEMGSKVDNLDNKNMLSQTAANYSYILDKASNDWKETGVGITTWSNIWSYKDITGATVSILGTAPAKDKIWRKHKTYVWNGVKDANGIFINYDKINGSKDDNFNWAIGVGQPSQWKQTSEVTLYNHYSTPLEMKDVNGNLASTKMGDKDTKIMVTGNAGYNEMFYCGAENTTDVLGVNWLEPDIKMTNATRTNRYVHSGKLSVEATSSSEFGLVMKSNEHRTGKYKVSVWVHKSSAPSAALYVNVNGSNNVIPFTESYTAGNWVLKSAIVNFNKESSYTINVKSINSTAVYLDDLMIRPVSSTISGYVYNEWDELTHIIGNNGLATRFEYDAAGRLIKTYIEVLDDADNGISGGFKLKSVNKINFKGLTQ